MTFPTKTVSFNPSVESFHFYRTELTPAATTIDPISHEPTFGSSDKHKLSLLMHRVRRLDALSPKLSTFTSQDLETFVAECDHLYQRITSTKKQLSQRILTSADYCKIPLDVRMDSHELSNLEISIQCIKISALLALRLSKN